MRTGRKVLLAATIAAAALFAVVVIREAFFGYTAYFVIVPGARVLADGKPAAGWLHRGGKGQLLIVTRDVAGKRDSYWINRPDHRGGYVLSCGDWTAPKSPLVAIGDVNPPCLSFSFNQPPISDSPKPSPKFGRATVEFTAEDGKRITVAW